MTDEPKRRKRRGEREDGRILVTLVTGVNEQGKKIRKYFYGRTRQEAERKRTKYINDLHMGMSDLADKITVKEWSDLWFKKYKVDIDESTVKTYKAHMKRLNAKLGKKLVKTVSEADLQDALNEVSGMSTSTIDKYYSLITQLFSKAYNNRIIIFDPSCDLQMPNGTKGTHRALERWESELILKNWHYHRVGIWVMLMLLLGLRRGEMIALKWDDIDLDNLQVNVHQAAAIRGNQSEIKDQTKTLAGMRVLPICEPLYQALATFPKESRTGLVCTTAKGKQISSSAFKRGWDGFNLAMNRILKHEPINQQGRRTDLEDEPSENPKRFSIRAHDLRYTFATALYDAGTSVKAAQYYLGHADVRMTMDLYTQLSSEREKRERSELTTFLNKWIGIQTPIVPDD